MTKRFLYLVSMCWRSEQDTQKEKRKRNSKTKPAPTLTDFCPISDWLLWQNSTLSVCCWRLIQKCSSSALSKRHEHKLDLKDTNIMKISWMFYISSSGLLSDVLDSCQKCCHMRTVQYKPRSGRKLHKCKIKIKTGWNETSGLKRGR